MNSAGASTASTTTKESTFSTTQSTTPTTGEKGKAEADIAPQDRRVSAWVIAVVVCAALLAVLVTVYLIYRWNNRYTGSFKPRKNELDGDVSNTAQHSYMPAFFAIHKHGNSGEPTTL